MKYLFKVKIKVNNYFTDFNTIFNYFKVGFNYFKIPKKL